MRRHVVNALKLIVAGLLVWFVLGKVEWTDRITTKERRGPEHKLVEVGSVPGLILGDWKQEEVRFRPEGREDEVIVRPGEVDDRVVEVRPGLLTVVKAIEVGTFLLGALCYFVVASFSSIRWWWLLRVNGIPVGRLQAFRLTWIGIFFNNVVPGLTGGDVVKAVWVARLAGEKTRPILSVLVDRVLGLLALGLLAAVVVLFDFANFREIGTLIFIGFGALALLTLCFFSKRVRKLIRLKHLLEKLPMSGLLKKVDQAIYFYRGHMRGIGLWFAASVVNHALGVIGVTLIGASLGIDLPLTGYLVLVPVINIVSAVPIAPAGWGVGEYLYQKLFTDYSIRIAAAQASLMPTLALVLSVVYRIHLMLWSLLGSVFLAFEKGRPTEAQVAAALEDPDRPEAPAGAGSAAAPGGQG
ncbi:MAG: lysylphosphatidylglycerol synthase transmembrane domain-containing protein [Planctomycetota bacterium]